MRLEQILATLIIALLAGTLGAYLVSTARDPAPNTPALISALAQVASSGKLRCGYIENEPRFSKTANGAFSGIWYRLTEALAERAKLQVVWTAATTPETLVTDLKAKKFDALCTGLTPSLLLAKELGFSAPAYVHDGKGEGFAVAASAGDLRDFLSLGLATLQAEGEIDAILQKFAPQPSPFQRAK